MTAALPPAHSITLGARAITYLDVGSGPTLVFVHGLLLNSGLWRHVIPPLAQHFRCIALDLPLGGHTIPQPADADQTPAGVAQLITDFITALDLHDVTLVGNDTGGALCQIVIARHPARITRLVLTNCDAFEAFFPPLLASLSLGPRLFGPTFTNIFAGLLTMRRLQRLVIAFGSLRRYSDAELDAYLTPLLRDPAIRRDVHRFLATVANHYTLTAAQTFSAFHHPVLLVWGTDDFVFSQRLAHRLQAAFPSATLELVPGSRAYLPEDQPAVLVEQIIAFAARQDLVRKAGRTWVRA